uniref:Birch protein n=1 Tax=Betula platyphylla TaxID=78630 RepID=A0A9E9L7W1_BETPL|nr:birch protein [Betula platyphylla]
MEVSVAAIFILVAITIVTVAWRILNWVWVRPKYLERRLREQGFAGNPYRIFFGDLKESSMMSKQANSKPINLSDDISPRIVPIVHHTLEKYGKNSFMWFGPRPRVIIMDPEQIKDILTKMGDFRKVRRNPLTKLLSLGVLAYEDEKWAKHRKIINPAFRMEKLKEMLHAFYQCCNDMISQWERLIGEEGSCELDVWPYIENLSGDVISRSAFGSSYTEGKRIFQLQKEQAQLVIKAVESVYIPGWR